MPFSATRTAMESAASSITRAMLKSISSKSSRPASIFEMSRMSLMSPSSVWPLERAICAYSRCSEVSGVSRSNPVIPITPFKGVRIS